MLLGISLLGHASPVYFLHFSAVHLAEYLPASSEAGPEQL